MNPALERLIADCRDEGFTLGWAHSCGPFLDEVWLRLGVDCTHCGRVCP